MNKITINMNIMYDLIDCIEDHQTLAIVLIALRGVIFSLLQLKAMRRSRDLEFARKYNLTVREVIRDPKAETGESEIESAFEDEGVSGPSGSGSSYPKALGFEQIRHLGQSIQGTVRCPRCAVGSEAKP